MKMLYNIGDNFSGITQRGYPYTGTIERIHEPEKKYFVRWNYGEMEQDRLCWYPESWLVTYVDEHDLISNKIVVETLDEELFTI